MKVKKTYSLESATLKAVDDYSEKTRLPKSAIVEMAINQYLDAQKMMNSMPEMLEMMKQAIELRKKELGE